MAELSYLHIQLLRILPVVGMLVPVPLGEVLEVEIYFTLRANPALKDDLVSKAFIKPVFLRSRLRDALC